MYKASKSGQELIYKKGQTQDITQHILMINSSKLEQLKRPEEILNTTLGLWQILVFLGTFWNSDALLQVICQRYDWTTAWMSFMVVQQV